MTATKTLPREIRTSLLPKREDVLSSHTNMFFVALGQFITHDIGLSRLSTDGR